MSVTGLDLVHLSSDGFDAVTVNTGALALTLVPALGGKLSSLRDLRTGRQWLWQNPRIPYQRLSHGDSYIEKADSGGWDECFPTVAPCAYPSPPWTGAALPDHGELWSQAAPLDVSESAGAITLRNRWRGSALPYTFDRALTLANGSARLHFDYSVMNEAEAPLQFIWSAHPLLAIEPGMQLLLPAWARFHCGTTLPLDLIAGESDLQFPRLTRELDLTTLPDASTAMALKLWSDPLPEGWATVRARDGELRMRWDIAQLPQVALWLNLGAWAGDGGAPYYNLGLEPCIGAQDSLADAVNRFNRFESLPPHDSRSWSLEVELVAFQKDA